MVRDTRESLVRADSEVSGGPDAQDRGALQFATLRGSVRCTWPRNAARCWLREESAAPKCLAALAVVRGLGVRRVGA